MRFEDTSKYKDIIHTKEIKSKKPRMPRYKRAAQFSPFSALTGFEESITEASRSVDSRPELADHMVDYIGLVLKDISKNPNVTFKVKVEYFEKDKFKNGGLIREKLGLLKEVREYENELFFNDLTTIPFRDILNIEILTWWYIKTNYGIRLKYYIKILSNYYQSKWIESKKQKLKPHLKRMWLLYLISYISF